jgi:hypothetical protein
MKYFWLLGKQPKTTGNLYICLRFSLWFIRVFTRPTAGSVGSLYNGPEQQEQVDQAVDDVSLKKENIP